MIKTRKSFISLLLVMVMLLACAVPAFAENSKSARAGVIPTYEATVYAVNNTSSGFVYYGSSYTDFVYETGNGNPVFPTFNIPSRLVGYDGYIVEVTCSGPAGTYNVTDSRGNNLGSYRIGMNKTKFRFYVPAFSGSSLGLNFNGSYGMVGGMYLSK